MTKVLLLGIGRWGANHLRVLNSLPIDGAAYLRLARIHKGRVFADVDLLGHRADLTGQYLPIFVASCE